MSILCLFYDISTFQSFFMNFYDFMPSGSPAVGKHHRVCSLLTGVFNSKPPRPRYTFIWDVEKVLTYLNGLKQNENLTVKLLTHKLTMLLALAAASRGSEINILSVKYMTKSEEKYVFTFDKLFKSWHRGDPPPSIEYTAFPSNRKLCVVTTLDYYLKISNGWRNNEKNQLLLSFVQPHTEVKKSTIAGWIKSVLKESGIDTNLSKPHSVRSASSSKANMTGLCTRDILKRGNWSNKSVWQRHYKKFVVSSAQKYQNSVFSGNALN